MPHPARITWRARTACMVRYGMILLLLLPQLASAQSLGSRISIRAWANDLAKLESSVIAPLREEFSGRPCQATLAPYVEAYADRLRAIQGEVSSFSYVVFREAVLVVAESLMPFREKAGCETIPDKWALLEHQLKVQLEFTGNVLGLLDIAGAL